MQVSFSEEFGFYLKSQVEKSTRLGLRKATVIATDQLTTFNKPPLPLPSTTPPQPRAYMDTSPSQRCLQSLELSVTAGAARERSPQRRSMLKCATWWDFAQRPRKAGNLLHKSQALGSNLPLSNILGPCWGLGPSWHKYKPQREHPALCHLAAWGKGCASFWWAFLQSH